MADIGTLNPEQMLQQQQILRQQKMAEMLMQQGMQQPQGQMVSGHYVAPSIFQSLGNLANVYMGQRGVEKAEQAQLDLAKRLRADETSAMADFMQEKQGRPAEMFAAQAGPTPTGGNIPLQESRAAIAPNPQGAYANLLQNPKASTRLQNMAFTKLTEGPMKVGLEDTLLDPFTMKPVYTGAGKPRAPLQIDTGTAIELRDPNNPTVVLQRIPKSISPADAARLADEGITGYGGGGQPMVRTGAPVGQPMGQQQGQPAGQPQGQQTVMPPLNVVGLSPKAAREAQAEQAKNYQENVKNAYEVAKIFPAIEKALPNAHGSGIGNIMGGVANFVGYESSQNAADAELKVMSDKLLKAVPRFSGPQSDKDVASYKEAAGSIGDASLPMNVRMAALNTIKELNKPYAPNLNWDSQAPKQPEKVSLGATPMYATNGNQRIVSNDGGKTWQPAR
jgi:hypothetical protein